MVINMPKKYYTRIVENELDQLLGIFGAVLIEGPKWCGKTTTAETRAASRLLLMDPSRNFENRLRAETDPALAVSGEVPRLIDEWQEVPKLWDAARFECDNRSGEPGQFIFTGSADGQRICRHLQGSQKVCRYALCVGRLYPGNRL